MARRLHSSTLGGSRKWAELESDSHRMLYERVIDITDAYGRFDADPVMVKAQAIPRLTTSIDEVEAALDDMERVGLIERWEVAGNPYGYIVAFEKFNNLDPAKEAQTTIPGPDGVIPIRPDRKDRSKPKANPKSAPGKSPARAGQTQGKSRAAAQTRDANTMHQAAPLAQKDDDRGRDAAPTEQPQTLDARRLVSPDPDGIPDPGREVGKPRAEDGQELGTLYGYGYGYVDEEQELNPPTPQKAEPLPPPDVEAAPRRALGKPQDGKNGRARSPAFDPASIVLPEFVSPDVWRDFVEDRKTRKRPLTPRAVELTLADLAKTPLDADEMLRTSIKRGWTGVFPLDRNKPRPASAATDAALDQYRKRGL